MQMTSVLSRIVRQTAVRGEYNGICYGALWIVSVYTKLVLSYMENSYGLKSLLQ